MHIRFLLLTVTVYLQYTAGRGHNLLSEGVVKDIHAKAGINYSSTCGLTLSSTSIDLCAVVRLKPIEWINISYPLS